VVDVFFVDIGLNDDNRSEFAVVTRFVEDITSVRPTQSSSFVRTVTVGFGFQPNLLTLMVCTRRSWALFAIKNTTGGEFHPALKTYIPLITPIISNRDIKIKPVPPISA